jgi:hypothetical protein
VKRVNGAWLNAEKVARPKPVPNTFGLDLQNPIEDVERLVVVLAVGRHAVALRDPALPQQEGVAVVLRFALKAEGVSQQSQIAAAVGRNVLDFGGDCA